MQNEWKYVGNTPFLYQPGNRTRQVVGLIAFVALGLFVGWDYAFAFLGGIAVWSVSI